jgi:hypothetical protein
VDDRTYFGAPAHLRQLPRVVSAQSRVDAIQAEFRSEPARERPSIRRDPPPPPPVAPPTDDELQLRLAEELDYARRMIETLGDTLSADAALLMRHMVEVQSIDIVGQMLGHIANVVRSSDPAGAVHRIGMGDLKARLTRKPLL